MWFSKCASLVLLAALGPSPEDLSLGYRKKMYRTIPSRLLICEQVFKAAKKHKMDPNLAISLAFHESKFTYTPSPKGAIGPMQVMRKYVPKRLHKKPIEAGLWALRYWKARTKTLCDALAQYNDGNDGSCEDVQSGRYARSIIAMRDSL